MKLYDTILARWGLHCFLLPLFFLLHTYLQYYGLVPAGITLQMLGWMELIFLGGFLLLRLFRIPTGKSLLMVTTLGIGVLFYGVWKDVIGNMLHLRFLARYSVLLPLTTIVAILLVVTIYRKKDLRRVNLFLNILLLLSIGADGLFFFQSDSGLFLNKNLLVSAEHPAAPVAAAGEKPDIYYLLFDCYPGSRFLYEHMQFDNSGLDSALHRKGFYIADRSFSNYNRTAFSMAATLNAGYLKGIQSYIPVNALQYRQTLLTVRHAWVPQYFTGIGYDIYNLSIFDIGAQPALRKESFLTRPPKDILFYNTVFERVRLDIGWHFAPGLAVLRGQRSGDGAVSASLMSAALSKRAYNQQVADSLLRLSALKKQAPKFVYAHFYLPHPPFFYTSDGVVNRPADIMAASADSSKDLFLSYLQYTNGVINSLTNRILKDSPRPPVIIVQSDHGFTDFRDCPPAPALHFKNYSAFYFPDRDYSLLYDSISNVNTFRVLCNKYFHSQLPLLADSSVYLDR